MNRGYFCVWRKIEDSAVFQNEGLLKVFLWCLIRANHKESFVQVKTGRGFTEVKLIPGSFIFGRESAAKGLHMPASTVWKRILKLKKLEILNIESNSHYSIIYVVNWYSYQEDHKKRNIEGDRQGTGKEHRQSFNHLNNNIFSSDSIEIRLSDLLFQKILDRNPNHRKPDIQTWARDIDLMIRIDRRTPEDIRRMIELSQSDTFWMNNILSTAKLRKQFDQLMLKLGGNGNGTSVESQGQIMQSTGSSALDKHYRGQGYRIT